MITDLVHTFMQYLNALEEPLRFITYITIILIIPLLCYITSVTYKRLRVKINMNKSIKEHKAKGDFSVLK